MKPAHLHTETSESIQKPNWLTGFCVRESLASNESSTNPMPIIKECFNLVKMKFDDTRVLEKH